MTRGIEVADGMPDPAAVIAASGVGGHAVAMVPVAGAWSNRAYRRQRQLCGQGAARSLAGAALAGPAGAAWRFEQAALAAGIAMPEPAGARWTDQLQAVQPAVTRIAGLVGDQLLPELLAHVPAGLELAMRAAEILTI